jgi:uncharacterized protein YecT (DUF1311 family)
MLASARFSTWLLCAALLPLPQVFAQQASSAPQKVVTPEQSTYQEQYQAWEANYRSLQAQAKQIYDAEMAREKASEKAGNCPGANTTFDINVCLGELAQTTDDSLTSFEQVIRGLQAPEPKMPGKVDSAPSPSSGPTPQQILAQFNQLEQSWEQYRKIACEAAYDQFYGGSGAGGNESQCRLDLTRDHIRELHTIYGEDFI